jgi:septal ring-binding cell division protein DamX
VVKYIAGASQGLTRRVNLIADKALLAAFSENTHTIRPKHVDAAVRDSEFSQRHERRFEPRYLWGAGWVVAGAALGVTAYVSVQHSMKNGAVIATPPAALTSNPLPDKAIISSPTAVILPPSGSPAPSAAPAPTLGTAPTVAPATVAPAALAAREAAAAKAAPETAVASLASPATATANKGVIPPVSTIEKAPPAAPEAAPVSTRDALELRLAATREWLAGEGQGTYSIQLLGAENPEHLKHHLNVISKIVEMNQLFVYRTVAKQKPSLTVLYGSYQDRRSAQEALRTLPASLKAYRPILRTVQGIRGEIRQHQTSEQRENPNSG